MGFKQRTARVDELHRVESLNALLLNIIIAEAVATLLFFIAFYFYSQNPVGRRCAWFGVCSMVILGDIIFELAIPIIACSQYFMI